jgi:transcriptional regulator with XRE-family HTH domain
MSFWIRLKSEIKAKNTTQEWISGKIDVPLSTFRKWMTRKTYPNLKEGVEIANLLDTSAEYLITGTGLEKLANSEGLNNNERKLINIYRKLSTTDQENALLAMSAWAGKSTTPRHESK